mmetsp:Transcript_11484/g.34046  ORF Transcript_11484/g.34046 Transcript_11484/m.34046 type:complete len:378 (+) Transcript_11484:55-1188(+)
MDLQALLAWGRGERARLSQRTASANDLPVAVPAPPAPRELWRAEALYARSATTWNAAGVVSAAPHPLSNRRGPDEADEIDVHIHVGKDGTSSAHVACLDDWLPEPAPFHNSRETVSLTLVSQQQLFAHQLYPSAVAIARLLDAEVVRCQGRAVLELGAGPALPCIIAAARGARAVVATDYPDDAMLKNTHANLDRNLAPEERARTRVAGLLWGRDPQGALDALEEVVSQGSSPSGAEFGGLCAFGCGSGDPHEAGAKVREEAGARAQAFDLILLSDLLYELEHQALLRTCDACLAHSPQAEILVAFQPHDPVNLGRQRDFFTMAEQPPFSFVAERMLCLRAPAMFEPRALDEVACRVHVHRLCRSGATAAPRRVARP